MRNSQACKEMLADRRNEQRNRIGGFYVVPKSAFNQLRDKNRRRGKPHSSLYTKEHTPGRLA